MQERIMTPEQVAQILQVHQFTVLKYIKLGKLKASKLGRVYRIRESDLETFLEDATTGNPKLKDPNTTSIKKSKNKNKKLIKTHSDVVVIEDEKKISDTEIIQEQVSKVGTVDDEHGHTATGGEDEYYILN